LLPQRPSLVRSAALLAIAAIVPVLAFGGFSALSAYNHQQTELREVAVADARRLSEAVDRELAGDIDAAEAMAALPQLDRLDLAGFEVVARREQARHPLWLTVILLDPQGRRLVNSRTSSRLGAASVGPVVEGRRSVIGAIAKGPREFGIPVRAPVVRGGKVVAVVTVVVRPEGLARVLQTARLPDQWIAGAVDGAGRLVARNPHTPALIGVKASDAALNARAAAESGIYEGLTYAGAPTVSAFWKSLASGWSVHIAIPRTAFEAPLRRSMMLFAGGLAASLLLAGLFLTLLFRELGLRRSEAAAAEQSHRLEALGRLTGGVAHDFNNLLMIIQGNAEILQRRKLAEGAERPVAAIREATGRAARLTRELLIFARGGQAENAVIDLNATLKDFLGAIQQAVGPAVEVRNDLAPDTGRIEVDRVQLELAVLNLAVNARDAMPGGGTLTIATRRASDALVQLSVSDTGHGIPDEIRSRVFDPFFTTKPPGSGTGLGLTQVYGFAKHAGGFVELQSRMGRGATVVLRLPVARAEAEAAAPAAAPIADAAALAGRRVLVLDDNAEVRSVSADYLREQGAVVIEAASAAEGLAILEKGGVEAVVSDIVMPGGQSGVDLAAAARELWPDLPVLLVSGYSASIAEAGAQGFRVLRKPYALAELGGLLTDMLRPPPGPAG
jgi:signal transduction histidine kinase